MLTYEQRIIQCVDQHPGITATLLSRRLKIELDCISSTLRKLFNKGKLNRIKGAGVRGGFGYYKAGPHA